MTRDPEFENIAFEVAHAPSNLRATEYGRTMLTVQGASSARDASRRLRQASVAPDQYEAGMADYWNHRRMEAQRGDVTTWSSRRAERHEVHHLARAVAQQQ